MSEVQSAIEKVAEKLSKRNGPCDAAAVTCSCEAYAHAKITDGFPTCVCGHTRWAHAERTLDP